jgi:signal transduction histidine kinase
VQLLSPEGRRWRQVWPPEAAGASAETEATVEVVHGGEAVGEIAVGAPARLGAADLRLLDELAAPAGLALSTVRLTFELRERLVQVEAGTAALRGSQERLVAARREEQERLRGEVGHAIGPLLRSTRLALGRARGRLAAGPAELAEVLDVARGSAAAGLEALRRLARGIVPPQLHEIGPAAALEVWASEEALPADVTGTDEGIQADPAAAAALFFCSARSVAALCRTYPARVAVELGGDDAGWSFWVVQERGEAAAGWADPGLEVALRDRVEALGGRLELGGADGRVTLAGRLPRSAVGRPPGAETTPLVATREDA